MWRGISGSCRGPNHLVIDSPEVSPICFLDDITVKNVIVQNGALRGLVDFDCVCYGDPLYWIGLTATTVACDVGTEELFYVDELCRCGELTAEQRGIAALYAAWIALDFLHRFAAQETDAWRARMLAAIDVWLAAAV